jgi:sugar/nucleoside kinase (ribokinase family)
MPLTRSSLVERAQMLLISAEDVAGDGPSLTELFAPGQELVVTHGASGALWVRAGTARYLPPMPKRDPIDATGAGDAFLGAWAASRLLLGDAEPWRALVVASAMASLSTQARTLEEFPRTSDLCEVLVRLRDRHLG